MAAYGVLYTRHRGAALHVARRLFSSPAQAEDAISEAFVRILALLRAGQGPETAFRAYLRRTVRNVACDWFKKDQRLEFTDDFESHADGHSCAEQVEALLDQTLAVRAFAALPQRWQLVLWYTTVLEHQPQVVAQLLGVNANTVTSLAYRAREGLRREYLQAYIGDDVAKGCQPATRLLGAHIRGSLGARESLLVLDHLSGCVRCQVLSRELADVNPKEYTRGVETRTAALAGRGPVGRD